jgi:hypothetical protein
MLEFGFHFCEVPGGGGNLIIYLTQFAFFARFRLLGEGGGCLSEI